MAVKILARGVEEVKKRNPDYKPGLQTGSVTRKGLTRTTRSPSGDVEKTEEVIKKDGKKYLKTTAYNKPELAGAPGTSQQQKIFYDASGNPLTPYESYVIRQTYGPSSTYKPGSFGTEGTTTYSTVTAPTGFKTSATNIAATKNILDINQGIATQNKIQNINQGIKDAISSGDEGKLRLLQEERSELQRDIARRSTPSYGKYEPLKPGEELTTRRFMQQGAGLFSKGFRTFGSGSELALQNVKERQQLSLAWDLDNNRDQRRTKGNIKLIDFSKGVVSGGVTTLGESKLAAGAFIGAGLIGGAIGASKGALGGAKIFKLTPGATRATQLAAKGIRYGFVAGGVGLVGGSVLLSENKGYALGQVAGGSLAFGTSFNAGKQAGLGLGGAARQGVLSAKTNLLERRYKGKVLTERAGRELSTLQKQVPDVRVQARPVQEVRIGQLTTRGTTTTSKGIISKTGGPQLINPAKAARQYVQISGQQVKASIYSNQPTTALLKPPTIKYGTKSIVTGLGRADRTNIFILDYQGKVGYVLPSGQFGKLVSGKPTTTVLTGGKAVTTGPTPEKQINLIKGGVSGFNAPTPTTASWTFRYQGQVPYKPLQIPKLTPGTDFIVVKQPGAIRFVGVDQGKVYVVEALKTSPTRTYTYGGTKSDAIILGPGETAIDLGGASAVVLEKPKTSTKAKFKPLSNYQGGSADLNPSYEQTSKGYDPVYYTGKRFSPLNDQSIDIKPVDAVEPKISITPIIAPGNRRGSVSRTGTSSGLNLGTGQTSGIESITGSDVVSGTNSAIEYTTDLATSTGSSSTTASSTSIFPSIGRPTPTNRPTPSIPPIKASRKDVFEKKGRVFQAFTRVKGKLRFLGTPSSSRKTAFGKGSSFVERTPARTFGVADLGSGKAFKGIDFKGESKKYKKRKGKFGFVFIEPSKRAINTAGEIKGITLKGKSKRRRK